MAKEKFDRSKPHVNVGTIDNATEEKYIRIIVATVTLFFLLFFATVAEAVVYEPLPHWPTRRGFNYWLNMSDYSNLLLSNMPYEVMQGYIVADSIVPLAPHSKYLPELVGQLNLESDTVAYLYKHWYYMNEYDPLRYQAFLKEYPTAKVNGDVIQSCLYTGMYWDGRMDYVYPSYILHIYVNNTVWIDTANTKYPNNFSETVAFCKVLDTLKGGSFPSLDKAIFYNGDAQGEVNVVAGSTYAIPQQTDIVFSYMDQWQRWEWGPSLIDENGEHWLKPNKEYIVFLEIWGEDNITKPDNSIIKHYYSISPFRKDVSRSMYPIENGYVIDERNVLGFGEKVPVDMFKQGIMDKINEIKNYGK